MADLSSHLFPVSALLSAAFCRQEERSLAFLTTLLHTFNLLFLRFNHLKLAAAQSSGDSGIVSFILKEQSKTWR